MQNLLENACKFSRKRDAPRVEVGAHKTAHDRVTLYVRDNGIGFDESAVDRMFAPFQRLHTASEYAGTGIGLATVKRIVDLHRGRVYASSPTDQGATFYVELPAE